MKFLDLFLHFLVPRTSNNHRARALHLSTIPFYITALLVFQVGLTAFTGLMPGVLGYASNISVSELLVNTNARRIAAGEPPLVMNSQLSSAAEAKANDMFANQYWAHTSPQGRDPWSFIVQTGYNYLFAGENLARDFGDSKSVVDAWMNSPSHRDNLLNARYKEVGFAVVNGKYGSSETTLVVQMFGTKPGEAATVEVPAQAPAQVSPAAPEVKPASPPGMILKVGRPMGEGGKPVLVSGPTLSVLGVTKGVSAGLVVFLIGVLLVDGFLVYKRKVVRLSGHNLAHMLMLLAVLAALNLIGRGAVL